MVQILKLIATRGFRQKTAAKTLGVTQPRVSDLLRGRIDLFSTDAPVNMLAHLGATFPLMAKVRRAVRAFSWNIYVNSRAWPKTIFIVADPQPEEIEPRGF